MIALSIKTRYKTEMIDITETINEEIIKSGINASAINIFTPHSTCGVFVCENKDPNIQRDLLKKLHDFFPSDGRYAHSGGNGDAHMKAAYMGSSVVVPVENAQMLLGPWQGVFFADFDGPRDRRAILTLL
ncbi:MAG: secondary thiamine-phosphate synthase enzyme YjbQ [Helicobacteraceae bacterium]|jgi:secondary thiamine-phosphate synthase enzyme|nr:secondary thiamine-phosphate synthase enzyme YjbQ [Helicobacteraceae bacterium]